MAYRTTITGVHILNTGKLVKRIFAAFGLYNEKFTDTETIAYVAECPNASIHSEKTRDDNEALTIY